MKRATPLLEPAKPNYHAGASSSGSSAVRQVQQFMLLVFSDDWGRHPSSSQHLIRRLLPRHRVTWVNTIGMRTPTLDWSSVRRGCEKLFHWSNSKPPTTIAPANPSVVSPLMWPWFRRRHDRWLNKHLLLRGLTPLVRRAGEPVFAVTSIPVVADIMEDLPVERWTYYCVDDFSVWPGLDHGPIEQMERQVIARCDEAIAVSQTLADRLAVLGRESKLLSHGVDLDFWRELQAPSVFDDLSNLERPLVVFWGVVDQRMNAEWVARLAADMTRGTILLVGPLDAPDARLLQVPRVVHRVAVPLNHLPELGSLADVLVMPYADLPVTRAMQPLKMKEYLATGKPVVVSPLPAALEWADCLDVAENSGEFSAAVRGRIATGVPAEQLANRQRLDDESWAAKALRFEELILGRQPAAVE